MISTKILTQSHNFKTKKIHRFTYIHYVTYLDFNIVGRFLTQNTSLAPIDSAEAPNPNCRNHRGGEGASELGAVELNLEWVGGGELILQQRCPVHRLGDADTLKDGE